MVFGSKLKLLCCLVLVWFLLGNSKASDDEDISNRTPTALSSHEADVVRTQHDVHYESTTNDDSHLCNSSAADIVSICEAYANVFAEAASEYTRCFLVNAKPLHLCLKCIKEYLILNKAYSELEKTTDRVTLYGSLTVENCNSWVLNADRVMAIQQTKAFFENLWTTSQCHNCFATYSWNDGIKYEVASIFTDFNDLELKTRACFKNFTTSQSSNSTTGRSKACVTCKDAYVSLTDYYMQLDTKYGDKLCMDIVDSMNHTRRVWGREFNCTGNTRQDGITITISVLFTLVPAVFYVGVHIHYQRLENKIVKQNRMRRSRNLSGRGSILEASTGGHMPVELHASGTSDMTASQRADVHRSGDQASADQVSNEQASRYSIQRTDAVTT